MEIYLPHGACIIELLLLVTEVLYFVTFTPIYIILYYIIILNEVPVALPT